jgi:hypothetical protein
MITREAPLVVSGAPVAFGDCATLDSTNGGVINGDVIDRLQFENKYHAALPFFCGKGWGTTFAGKKLSLVAKLQHGDSGDGGDMADYSTGEASAAIIFQTSAETTPMQAWSTGQQHIYASDKAWGLHGAKRYVRCVITHTLVAGATTSTADTNFVRGVAGLCLLTPDKAPLTGTCSTATST